MSEQSDFLKKIESEFDTIFDSCLVKHRSKLTRHFYRDAQVCSKWIPDDGPILFPDNTRAYYRKGNSEIVLQEFPPRVRIMKFHENLLLENSLGKIQKEGQVSKFNLALPYMLFLFSFKEGLFQTVYCAFNDRPLKSLDSKVLRPYLSNIDNTLRCCLGGEFNYEKLVKNNIFQQVSYILDHFWSTVYLDEWSQHFWNYKSHFANDPRLHTLKGWENASLEDPLFVIDDVHWLIHDSETIGQKIVNLLENESYDKQFQQAVYDELNDIFVDDLKRSLKESLSSIK